MWSRIMHAIPYKIIPNPVAMMEPMMLHVIIFSTIIPPLGFEPRKRDPKSPVLPLHHEGVDLGTIIVHYDARGSTNIDASHRTILRNVKKLVTHT